VRKISLPPGFDPRTIQQIVVIIIIIIIIILFYYGATAASGPGPPHFRGFTITLRHTTLGRNPLDE
jgi:hypothetical protein